MDNQNTLSPRTQSLLLQTTIDLCKEREERLSSRLEKVRSEKTVALVADRCKRVLGRAERAESLSLKFEARVRSLGPTADNLNALFNVLDNAEDCAIYARKIFEISEDDTSASYALENNSMRDLKFIETTIESFETALAAKISEESEG